jgi:hypothetical protein
VIFRRWVGWAVALALTVLAMAPVSTASAATTNGGNVQVVSSSAGKQAAPLAAGSRTGTLQAGKWKKVLWGWGWYTVAYSVSISASGGKAHCYSAPIPWPVSYQLPGRIYHRVTGYGDCWLYSPVNASYTLTPVVR